MNDSLELAHSAKGDVGDLLTCGTLGNIVYNSDVNYRRVAQEFYRLRPDRKEFEWMWEDCQMIVDGIDWMTRGQNMAAFGVLRKERLRCEKLLPEQQVANDIMGTAGDRVYFVTINYPDKFTDFSFMEEIMKHFAELKWVKKIKWVHEYHGKENNHPHTHIICTLYKKLSPRRLSESIYALKGIKKYCEGLNFVQVEKDFSRSWTDREEYIDGDKTKTKIGNVLLDAGWRDSHF